MVMLFAMPRCFNSVIAKKFFYCGLSYSEFHEIFLYKCLGKILLLAICVLTSDRCTKSPVLAVE